jgi:catechol 2,3-dioxygenase-like lactoylglutathione lyase family enzyme
MKITGAEHTSFTVSNLERTLDFYVDLLGFEVVHLRPQITSRYFRDVVGFPDGVIKGAFLRIPGTEHRLELFEYLQPRGVPADVRTNNPGSAHICLFVEDLPSAYQELLSKGVRFRSPPVDMDEGSNAGGIAVYMLDPDGITIELFQPPAKPPK